MAFNIRRKRGKKQDGEKGSLKAASKPITIMKRSPGKIGATQHPYFTKNSK